MRKLLQCAALAAACIWPITAQARLFDDDTFERWPQLHVFSPIYWSMNTGPTTITIPAECADILIGPGLQSAYNALAQLPLVDMFIRPTAASQPITLHQVAECFSKSKW